MKRKSLKTRLLLIYGIVLWSGSGSKQLMTSGREGSTNQEKMMTSFMDYPLNSQDQGPKLRDQLDGLLQKDFLQ